MQTDTLNNRYNIAFITLKTKHIFHKVTSKTFDLIYFYHNSKVSYKYFRQLKMVTNKNMPNFLSSYDLSTRIS